MRRADLAQKGDDDVFQKVMQDLKDKGAAVADAELRKTMNDFLAVAVAQIEGEKKPG